MHIHDEGAADRAHAIDDLLRQPISRRQALARAAAAGLLLPGVSMIAACGGGAASAGGKASDLTISSGANAVTLDPMVSFDGQSLLLWRCSYETLLGLKGNTTELEPRLAESFEYETGAKPRLVFHLRQGATFSDGAPVDADAVKRSIDRQVALKLGIAYAFVDVASVETPDESTVVVNYKRFATGQPDAFASPFGLYVISPKALDDHGADDHAQAWLRSHMVGSGPYVLSDYQANQRATFVRNEKYWGGWDGDHFERVIVEYISDPSAQRLSLERGESDLALFLPLDVAHSLSRQDKVEVRSSPSWNVQVLGLPCRTGPTSQRTVRQAISYGFDYGSYISDVLYGTAVQGRGPLPDAYPEFDKSVPQYRYDPDRARELLSEAGFEKGGFALKYIYETGYAWKRPLGELFQSNMKDLGIKVSIQELSPATFLDTLGNKDRAGHAFGMSTGPSITTAYDWLWILYAGDGSFNFTAYSNPIHDTLIERANGTRDKRRRREMFVRAQRILVEDAPYLFIAQPEYLQPMSPKLEGYQFNGSRAAVPTPYELRA